MNVFYEKMLVVFIAIVLFILAGCKQIMDGDGMSRSYTQISQEKAKVMMSRDDDHIIVDVRSKTNTTQVIFPGRY